MALERDCSFSRHQYALAFVAGGFVDRAPRKPPATQAKYAQDLETQRNNNDVCTATQEKINVFVSVGQL